MSGISPIGSYAAGSPMPAVSYALPSQSGGPGGPVALSNQGGAAAASATASQSAVLVSSTSIAANVESFVATYGPVASNNEILGALLLLLMLQYMQSDDEQEKKGLLGLLMGLAQIQQQAGQPASLMYSSTSLSIESTQMMAVSQQMAVGAYAGGGSIGSVPPVAPSGGGVDTMA